MNKMLDEKSIDLKLRTVYEGLKHDQRWKLLDLSEQIRTLMSIKATIVNLNTLNKVEEINLMDSENIAQLINCRGFNKIRRLDDLLDSTTKEISEVRLADPVERSKLILDLKKKLKSAVDLE